MAMGVIQFAIGVFGNVPCPILFGAAIDAACRTRDFVCGALGACASYDNDSLRHLFLGECATRPVLTKKKNKKNRVLHHT